MNRKKYLLISLAFGLLAALMAGSYIKRVRDGLVESYRPVATVVAKTDIPANSPVTLDMVAVENVPVRYRDETALSDVREAVGRTLLFPAARNAQLTAAHVTPMRFGSLSSKVERDMRAVALPIDDVSGAGGLIQPGDYVDVIAVYSYEVDRIAGEGAQEGLREKKKVRTLLQNVEVLAVGRRLSALETDLEAKAAEFGETEGPDEPARYSPPGVVILSLDPDDSQSVIVAKSVGDIYLALRGFGDERVVERSPLTATELFGEKVIAPPRVIWRVTGGTQ